MAYLPTEMAMIWDDKSLLEYLAARAGLPMPTKNLWLYLNKKGRAPFCPKTGRRFVWSGYFEEQVRDARETLERNLLSPSWALR